MKTTIRARFHAVVMMFLFAIMVPVELLLLAANWIVALISPSLGKRFMEWNIRTLPDKDFYNHNDTGHGRGIPRTVNPIVGREVDHD
jgi:hypothetical protein